MKLQLSSEERRCSSTSARELSMERMADEFEEVEQDNIGVGV